MCRLAGEHTSQRRQHARQLLVRRLPREVPAGPQRVAPCPGPLPGYVHTVRARREVDSDPADSDFGSVRRPPPRDKRPTFKVLSSATTQTTVSARQPSSSPGGPFAARVAPSRTFNDPRGGAASHGARAGRRGAAQRRSGRTAPRGAHVERRGDGDARQLCARARAADRASGHRAHRRCVRGRARHRAQSAVPACHAAARSRKAGCRCAIDDSCPSLAAVPVVQVPPCRPRPHMPEASRSTSLGTLWTRRCLSPSDWMTVAPAL